MSRGSAEPQLLALQYIVYDADLLFAFFPDQAELLPRGVVCVFHAVFQAVVRAVLLLYLAAGGYLALLQCAQPREVLLERRRPALAVAVFEEAVVEQHQRRLIVVLGQRGIEDLGHMLGLRGDRALAVVRVNVA